MATKHCHTCKYNGKKREMKKHCPTCNTNIAPMRDAVRIDNDPALADALINQGAEDNAADEEISVEKLDMLEFLREIVFLGIHDATALVVFCQLYIDNFNVSKAADNLKIGRKTTERARNRLLKNKYFGELIRKSTIPGTL